MSSRCAHTNTHCHISSCADTYLCLDHAKLVVAILRDVPYPGKSLVSRFFDNLQIPYSNTRNREIWNLKLYGHGRLHVSVPVLCANRRQAEIRGHDKIFLPLKLLNAPDDAILVWDVPHSANR